MAVRGGFTIRCCKELVKYVKWLLVEMQLPNNKWMPFLKIKIFIKACRFLILFISSMYDTKVRILTNRINYF